MSRVVALPPDAPPADDGSKPAGWWHESEDARQLVCDLCPRRCSLGPQKRGFCFVRQNRGGEMVSTTYGRSTGFCIDPIEKKPLNQFYPGTAVLSFGTAGCNLGCKFCQNWTSSRSRDVDAACEVAEPYTIAAAAAELRCRSVAFTYNDPIVWPEYAIDTARACRQLGVRTVAVTSGYITAAARAAFFQEIDAANVDLKAFSEDFYVRLTGGHLEPVLDTLRWLVHQSDTWVEITNLVIPGENDSPDELRRMCAWIADELGPDVPVHFSAFHPDFKLTDHPATPLSTLLKAYQTARRAGLRYVYTGNVSDREHQHTYCPGCGRVVIERDGYGLGAVDLQEGCCGHCHTKIAGRFDAAAGNWDGKRMPVRIASFAGREPAPAASDEQQPVLTERHEQMIFRAAGRRVADAVRAQPPVAMEAALAEVAQTPVYGTFVSLKRGGKLRSCCGYVGRSTPLAEALDRSALRAATDDPRFPPISEAELDELDMEVWLLWAPEPVTARGADRVKAVVIGKHGLQISRGGARGLLLPGVAVDYNLSPKDFLKQVCLKAALPTDAWRDDDTKLMTFEGRAIRGRLAACRTAEGPGRGGPERTRPATDSTHRPENPTRRSSGRPAPEDRPAAVAGSFYPANPKELDRMLEGMLSEKRQPQPWPAALVPHAGWIYSGRLAAEVFGRLEFPGRVIIFAPRHRPGGAEWAVAPQQKWLLPGRAVESDLDLAGQLVEGISGLEADAAAHRHEHAIEVQLPLLARLAPQARVVGVTIGGGDLPALLRFAGQMAEVLRPMPQRPLLIISSDMNHFADETQNRRLDRLAMDAIESLDPARVFKTVRSHRISMCGVRPCVIVMETLRQLGALHRWETVGYTTSAETSGDTDQVVGYAGMLLG